MRCQGQVLVLPVVWHYSTPVKMITFARPISKIAMFPPNVTTKKNAYLAALECDDLQVGNETTRWDPVLKDLKWNSKNFYL